MLLAVAGAGAALVLHAPMPWLLGPLLLVAATRMAGLASACPPAMRQGGQWVIGTSLGLYFTPMVVAHIGVHAGFIVASSLFAVALAAMGTWMLMRLAGTDLSTAWFASAIGGASEMANLAERHQARVDRVASAHSLRILMVVVIVPFAYQWAGLSGLDPTIPGPREVRLPGLMALAACTCVAALFMKRLKLTNPWVLGPLAVAAVLTANGIEWSALPGWLMNVGQLLIGWSLGDRYRPDFLHAAPRFMGAVALYTGVSLALTAVLAWLLAAWADIPWATLLLATTPGGIAEMTLTARALALGVPIVTAFHVTRMIFVLLVTGPIHRWLTRARSG
ncbi:AbrB family transcriptional regulator [Verticiella sediminum]|uniref:AbrB family transcriptional regulator n=1 Tax=Verticiella sediminum TaxID=1247510 RepID=A0A556AUE4_9BURK|nr:AbrB family transcriptional regulator [Verticiella sediminum]